ncbi:M48 family metallopeptidase [Mariniblastus sp.]|nr:M48 family metallopeptidase [Mariniblastus sp.]MDB4756883.1 M48 family metallopeptidase [Mariniblastus sp.]
MDFFASQDKARGKTKILVFYYGLAMLMMMLIIYVVLAALLNIEATANPGRVKMERGYTGIQWFHLEILVMVVFGVSLVVSLSSFWKLRELSGGGDKVASMLGGRRISQNTTDRNERVVMNVVEEMALASGIPVPPVFVLDSEPGINAFAAGYSPADAVIGVNRGTIETLNRGELQGVIAHEFSHILNGDMKINIRLIGVLFGIQVLAIIGFYTFRFAGLGAGRRGGDNKAAIPIFVVGGVIMIVGFIGKICAGMIQAAISRQREYLADASAVQFTRDPSTIGGALKVIGAHASGTKLVTPDATQASHMFFAEGVVSNFNSMSTHPPLLDRIKRIDPTFSGQYSSYMKQRHKTSVKSRKRPSPPKDQKNPLDLLEKLPLPGIGGAGVGPMGEFAAGMPGAELAMNPVAMIAGIGMLGEDHVAHSQQLVEKIPASINTAVHDAFSGRCVVYAMLLDDDPVVHGKQLATIESVEGKPSVEETSRLVGIVNQMPQNQRLPCLEMVQGTLSQLSLEQYKRFGYCVFELVKADHKMDLFEFILQHLLLTHLDRRFGLRPATETRYKNMNQIKSHIELILSVLVYKGNEKKQEYVEAFQQAAQALGEGISWELTPRDRCNFQLLEQALTEANLASPAIKKQILHAAATAIAADGKITVDEAELFRAFAESIECPVPPIFATHNTD